MIAQQAALKETPASLYSSLETSRTVGSAAPFHGSKVEMQKLKTGNLEHADWDQIYEAIDKLSTAKIYIDDTRNQRLEIKIKAAV